VQIEGVDVVEFAKEHAERAKDTAESQGHGNVIPMIHARQEGGPDVIFGLVGAPPGQLWEAIQLALRSTGIRPTSLVIMCDAFYESVEGEGVPDYTLGSLAHRFSKGDPNVKEAINTVVLSSDISVLVNQVYRWTPVDGWEWEEANVHYDPDAPGPVSDWEFDRLINFLPRRSYEEIMGDNR
jgi:hypothetical protein